MTVTAGSTAKLTEKIGYLNALIGDARTPAGEREAAERARARVAAALAKTQYSWTDRIGYDLIRSVRCPHGEATL